MFLQLRSKALKNVWNELKLNPWIGIFKDFVQNCKTATFKKHHILVAFVLVGRAFFTSLIKTCEELETMLELCQTSNMVLFAKIVNSLNRRSLFSQKVISKTFEAVLTTTLKVTVKWMIFNKVMDTWHVSLTKQSKKNATCFR